jgi:hypothetical protein
LIFFHRLSRIWRVMQESVARFCSRDGIMPIAPFKVQP